MLRYTMKVALDLRLNEDTRNNGTERTGREACGNFINETFSNERLHIHVLFGTSQVGFLRITNGVLAWFTQASSGNFDRNAHQKFFLRGNLRFAVSTFAS